MPTCFIYNNYILLCYIDDRRSGSGRSPSRRNVMQLPWQRCTHPYAHYTRETIKKQKSGEQKTCSTSPRFLSARTSECSLLSNIIYGFGEINIKNRKGKTTARTIKKARRKSARSAGERRPVAGAGRLAGGNPSAAALPSPGLIPTVKGYGD